MNSKAQEMILHLSDQCLRSELDLAAFCEDFVFHYLNLNEGEFKNICKDLFRLTSDYLMKPASNTITTEEIEVASMIFKQIQRTHERLIRYRTQS